MLVNIRWELLKRMVESIYNKKCFALGCSAVTSLMRLEVMVSVGRTVLLLDCV